MIEHELKTWPVYFRRVILGTKLFEVRKNDRDFQTGDYALLKEWDPETRDYTGNECNVLITYVLKGDQAFGVDKDWCIFGFKIIEVKAKN